MGLYGTMALGFDTTSRTAVVILSNLPGGYRIPDKAMGIGLLQGIRSQSSKQTYFVNRHILLSVDKATVKLKAYECQTAFLCGYFRCIDCKGIVEVVFRLLYNNKE